MKQTSSPDFNSTKNQVVNFAYAFRLDFKVPILACNRSPIGYRYYECCQVIKFPRRDGYDYASLSALPITD